MKFKDYLTEKYVFRFKPHRGDSFEVFVNPSSRELTKLAKDKDSKFMGDIRFSASHKKKKVWAWPALGALHDTIEEKLKFTRFEENDDAFSGVAELRGGKWVVHNSDQLESLVMKNYEDVLERIQQKDWKWLDKYISNASSFIGKF